MTIKTLNKKLYDVLDNFSTEIQGMYKEDDRSSANYGDINECSRHMFYVMDDFRKNIVSYLEELSNRAI